jgi:hypothetical protein
MPLKDHYIDASGEPILLPGPALDQSDHLYHPYPVSFEDAVSVLGRTERRRLVLGHLGGLLRWIGEAAQGDARVWVRGDLASTLRPEPAELDVVALVHGLAISAGNAWVARVLETRPRLSPLELVFAMIRAEDEESVERERRRSALRCRDSIGDPIVTGWLEVAL